MTQNLRIGLGVDTHRLEAGRPLTNHPIYKDQSSMLSCLFAQKTQFSTV